METEILKCDCCKKTLAEGEPCMRMQVVNAPGGTDVYREPETWFEAKEEEEERPRRGRHGYHHRLDMTRADYCLSCFKTRGVADALSVAEGVAPTRSPL